MLSERVWQDAAGYEYHKRIFQCPRAPQAWCDKQRFERHGGLRPSFQVSFVTSCGAIGFWGIPYGGRAILQPRRDGREWSGPHCCAQGQSRLLVRLLVNLIMNSTWKLSAPQLFLPWSFYFRGFPFVRVVVGNVGNISINNSHGGNCKPGGRGVM